MQDTTSPTIREIFAEKTLSILQAKTVRKELGGGAFYMKMQGLNDPLLKTEIALNVKLIPVVGVGAQCGRRFAISGRKYRDNEMACKIMKGMIEKND